jgi:hypothetical protein
MPNFEDEGPPTDAAQHDSHMSTNKRTISDTSPSSKLALANKGTKPKALPPKPSLLISLPAQPEHREKAE